MACFVGIGFASLSRLRPHVWNSPYTPSPSIASSPRRMFPLQSELSRAHRAFGIIHHREYSSLGLSCFAIFTRSPPRHPSIIRTGIPPSFLRHRRPLSPPLLVSATSMMDLHTTCPFRRLFASPPPLANPFTIPQEHRKSRNPNRPRPNIFANSHKSTSNPLPPTSPIHISLNAIRILPRHELPYCGRMLLFNHLPPYHSPACNFSSRSGVNSFCINDSVAIIAGFSVPFPTASPTNLVSFFPLSPGLSVLICGLFLHINDSYRSNGDIHLCLT